MKNKYISTSPEEAEVKKLLAAEARKVRHAEWWAVNVRCLAKRCNIATVKPGSKTR